jgi:hypothetical protein
MDMTLAEMDVLGRSKKSYNWSLLLVDINTICKKIKQLKRSLGLIDATSLVAGSMIGFCFIVTSAMARYWFSGLVASNLVVTSTVAAALSYGELAEWCQKQVVSLYTFSALVVSFSVRMDGFTVIQTGDATIAEASARKTLQK